MSKNAEQRFNRVGKTWSDSCKLNSDHPMDQTGPPGGIEPVNTSWKNLENQNLRNQTQAELQQWGQSVAICKQVVSKTPIV